MYIKLHRSVEKGEKMRKTGRAAEERNKEAAADNGYHAKHLPYMRRVPRKDDEVSRLQCRHDALNCVFFFFVVVVVSVPLSCNINSFLC